MRILFVTPYVPSRIRVRPFMFMRELSRRHEVSVLTLWASERERDDLADLARIYPATGVRLTRARALSNCLRALPTLTPLQGAYSHSPEFARLVRAAMADSAAPEFGGLDPIRGPFDVIHVEHLRAAYLGATIPVTPPTVIDAVDCISLLLERTRQHSHSLRQRLTAAFELPRMRRYEGKVLQRFDRVLATSPVDRVALRALNSRLDVSVITNGVDTPPLDLVDGSRQSDSIVFAGKMSYHANATAACYFARKVFPLVRARRPDARFEIVGSDPPTEVRALAQEPGVVVTGFVPDVGLHIRAATVAVAPMLVKVGVQNKVLEAMANATPVVATPAGVEGLEAKPGHDLLVGTDAVDFAEQVIRVLEQAELRGRLARAGRLYVERFHRWDVAARTLEDVYATVITAHTSRPVVARGV